jgi:flavodoxin I
MHQVLFYSKGGNTRKLADAIASELGVMATDIKTASILDPAADIIFLGSGCYGSKPGEEIMKFIEKNDFIGRKVALFGTSGGNAGMEVGLMATALTHKGATVLGRYHCKGKAFLLFSTGHPNQEDLDGARKFAREMLKLG